MPRTSRYNTISKLDLSETIHLCRICLTKSTAMVSMDSPITKEPSGAPSILEALEKVMAVKVGMNKKYPSTICAICKGLLKISYDLNIIFNDSQRTLTKYFQDILFQQQAEFAFVHKNKQDIAPVELIFKNKKYDLNDILIVEEEKEEKYNYQGFLNNLGKTVSAVFVNKSEISKCNSKFNNKDISSHLELYDNNVIENREGAVIQISLDELQDCNVNDLFSDHQIFDVVQENEVNEASSQAVDNIQNQNMDKENLVLRKIYKCDACNILCANRTRLKLHLKKIHLHQNPYLCEMCSSVSFHNSDTSELDIISCEECGSTNTKRRLIAKIKDNTQNLIKEYLCQICGFISNSPASARYHKKKHYEIQYHCNICDKKYHSKANLQWHINCHNNTKNLLCSVCGKKFNYYSALVYHMRIHMNQRKYVCNICDKRFYIQTALKRHIRTHTGERPYVCKCCGKSFFSPSERKRHEMIHTGQRPFKCQYCNKGFTSASNRKLHYMSHSGPHECDYCSRTFIKIEYLRTHINLKHREMTAV